MISSAHPPKTAVALKEAFKERVFACVSCQSEHGCMYVSLRVSLCTCGSVSKPVCSQSEVVSAGHSCSPPLLIPPPKASCLR